MRGKWVVVGLILVAVACIVCWPWGTRDELGDPPAAAFQEKGGGPGVPLPPSPTSGSGGKTAPDRDPALRAGGLSADAGREPSGPRTMQVCGRCVDAETRLPLAGCTIRLTARQFREAAVGGRRMVAELEDHWVERGAVDWRDPDAVVTGPDGRFAIRIPVPPPVPVELAVEHPERVPVAGTREDLGARPRCDVGDIPLGRGVIVTGVVRNTTGQRQPGVSVSLSRFAPGGPWIRPQTIRRARSDAHGRIRFSHPVPPAVWNIRARGRYLASGSEARIPADVERYELDVAVRSLPAITGTVVDDARAPVAGAWVDFHPHGPGSRFFANLSGPDGAFRLERRPEDSTGPVSLTAAMRGHEVVWREGSYAWGATGIVLVLPRGIDVPVRVVDADTSEPVERFGIRCFSTKPDQARVHHPHARLRHAGRHPGGACRVRGVRRGPNVLMVQPMDGEHLPNPWLRFEAAAGAAPLVVRVNRPVARTLQVVRKDGRPVAEAHVELVRPPAGAALTLKSEIGKPGRLANVAHRHLAILLQEGDTDDDGAFTLRGPPGEPLAIRLPGPCHLPRVVNDVVLAPGAEPLRVEVADGAVLTGRVRPLAVLDPPGRAADAAEPERAEGEPPRPALRLLAPRTRGALTSRAGQTAPIAEDGTFTFASVAPGDWDLLFTCSVDHALGAVRFRQWVNLPVGTVRRLKRDETRRVDLDLGHLVPGRIEGAVFLDDEPLADTAVTLASVPIDLAGQAPTWRPPSRTVRTDPRGRYAVSCFPGSYRMRLRVGDPSRLFAPERLESEEVVSVFPGARIVRDVHLRGAVVRIRVVGSDGRTPIAGLPLAWKPRRGGMLRFTDPTDADGRIRLGPVPLRPLVFRTWPASLRSPEARRKFVTHNPKTWRRVLVDVGTVTLDRSRGEHDHRIVMPAAAGY